MGEDGCLKIGDFGLSRTEAAIAAGDAAEADAAAVGALEAGANDDTPSRDPLEAAIVPRGPRSSRSDGGHTTGVGTASYASPEQLQGRQYGVRSDLFSLGLVLLELCCCFTTTHERADAFQSMRQPDGTAPAHLAARSPAVAQLAEVLCRTVPEQRPSAAKVLEMLDALDGSCGCEGCPGIASGDGLGGASACKNGFGGGGGGGGGDGGNELTESGDVRLREELAAKTRKVEEQVRGACFALCLFWAYMPVYKQLQRVTNDAFRFMPVYKQLRRVTNDAFRFPFVLGVCCFCGGRETTVFAGFSFAVGV